VNVEAVLAGGESFDIRRDAHALGFFEKRNLPVNLAVGSRTQHRHGHGSRFCCSGLFNAGSVRRTRVRGAPRPATKSPYRQGYPGRINGFFHIVFLNAERIARMGNRGMPDALKASFSWGAL
jgi:hypothetical protein